MMEPATEARNAISFGPFSLFVAERLLKKVDKPIPLGGRALDILIALAERPGEVVTHKELISTAWPDVTVEEANLRFPLSNGCPSEGTWRRTRRCSLHIQYCR